MDEGTVHESYLDFGFDEDLDDRPGCYEPDDEDEEEAPWKRRPKVVDFRPSPACVWSPAAKGLFHRLRKPANELMNVAREALDDWGRFYGTVRKVVVDPRGYRREVEVPTAFSSRRELIASMGHLTLPGELEALSEEVEATWTSLMADVAGLQRDMPLQSYTNVWHCLSDWRLLGAVRGCHPLLVWGWEMEVRGRIRQSEEVRRFYRLREEARRQDPQEREAYRRRDAARRKNPSYREYVAREEVREARAERERKRRASMTAEQKAAEAERKRRARAAKKTV